MSAVDTLTFTVEFKYELPVDLAERVRIYGTADPAECLFIDLDNDPAATFMDADWKVCLIGVNRPPDGFNATLNGNGS